MVDPFLDLVTPITVILGLIGLGTFIWNTVKGYNKRQDEKEKARLASEEAKEAIIKKDLETRGEQIRKDAIEQAADVKREVEGRASIIKTEIEATAKSLREHNIAMNDILKTAIRDVDEKVMRMLKDLGERASLTNGNVEKIRSEVQGVKEDIEDLWDRFDDTDNVLGTEAKTTDRMKRTRREQEFNRRRKRKEIKDTGDEQEDINRGYGSRRW